MQPSRLSSLIVGASGLLGSALADLVLSAHYLYRLEDEPQTTIDYEVAFLCAGTKGYAECEGNRAAFRADVDGNIRLARYLLAKGTFVVFVSTDAVEWALHTAYARNRFMVELAIGNHPNAAIFRPSKFDASNVGEVAKALADVGLQRRSGLTRWP
jgi:dTDP-4-dehydrorhamnose reductase